MTCKTAGLFAKVVKVVTPQQLMHSDAKLYDMVIKDKLIIRDLDYAKKVFQRISPFHLENFGLTWKKADGTYQDGTTFEMLVDSYLADRRIKNFLFDYLSDYEVQLRHVIGTVLLESFGAYGYLDSGHFRQDDYHKNFINDLENELTRANEPFVRHFCPEEGKTRDVPVYVAMEVITLGTLTKIFKNMRRPEQKRVSAFYGVASEIVLYSFFSCLAKLRNTCAHHGRLSNRRFTDGCAVLKADRRTMERVAPVFHPDPFRFFVMLLALMHVMDAQSNREIIVHFRRTFAIHPYFLPRFLDFPEQWETILCEAAGIDVASLDQEDISWEPIASDRWVMPATEAEDFSNQNES